MNRSDKILEKGRAKNLFQGLTQKERLFKLEILVSHILNNDLPHIQWWLRSIFGVLLAGVIGLLIKTFL